MGVRESKALKTGERLQGLESGQTSALEKVEEGFEDILMNSVWCTDVFLKNLPWETENRLEVIRDWWEG